MDIGIWGLGRMGFNMARRLVDSGEHRVVAGNRSPGGGRRGRAGRERLQRGGDGREAQPRGCCGACSRRVT